jgi:hypothetical protein
MPSVIALWIRMSSRTLPSSARAREMMKVNSADKFDDDEDNLDEDTLRISPKSKIVSLGPGKERLNND